MFDTVHLRLPLYDQPSKIKDVIAYNLDDVACHNFSGGRTTITGDLNGLAVSISDMQIKIKNGSLCKWYLGDNFQTMCRSDVQHAIERLSDELHLPFKDANITRMDLGYNIITKHPIDVYTSHLGELRYSKRLEQPNGLYYNICSGKQVICFYDKIREQKQKGNTIPEMFANRNVLRYEQRYMKYIAKQLGISEITAQLLYDEQIYKRLLNDYQRAYDSIKKINETNLNFMTITSKQQLYKMGVLSMAERVGGQVEMLRQIKEAQKRGELTTKQAYDLKQAVNDAYKLGDGITFQNDAILELDKQIKRAIRFYR